MKKLVLTIFVFISLALPSIGQAQDAGVQDAGISMVDTGAQPASQVVPDLDPGSMFVTLLSKIQGGELIPAFGAVLMLLVFAARALLATKYKWFKTKLGGSTLAFSISLVMAGGTSLLAGQPITLGLAATAMGVAWAAGGGWENFKDILNFFRKDKAEA
ncbi:MAG: hypothetical protein L3J47_00395 [Sulfurovum sp.]|nr:hypothetical protein [Sulfurovum sp.]